MSSSISALSNNGYYQLSDSQAGSSNTAQSNSTSALLQALLSSSNTQAAASSSSEAYLLDLSPQAQQYLNGAGNASGSAGSPLNPSSSSFVLNTQQQQEITNILVKYKDAPYTQATFEAIQNDLQVAGLDPTTLGREDQAQSFNSTQLLIDDLNGDTSSANSMINPDESTKSSNYMQQILGQWQTISGNTGDPSSSTSDSAVATSGA